MLLACCVHWPAGFLFLHGSCLLSLLAAAGAAAAADDEDDLQPPAAHVLAAVDLGALPR